MPQDYEGESMTGGEILLGHLIFDAIVVVFGLMVWFIYHCVPLQHYVTTVTNFILQLCGCST